MSSSLNIQELADAAATQLRAWLDAYLNVYANHPGDELLELPAIVVAPGTEGDFIGYYGTMGDSGEATVNFDLELSVDAPAGTEDSLLAVADFVSIGTSQSIHDAIMDDRTLGGVVQGDVVVLICRRPFRLVLRDDREVWRTVIPLQIYARKG